MSLTTHYAKCGKWIVIKKKYDWKEFELREQLSEIKLEELEKCISLTESNSDRYYRYSRKLAIFADIITQLFTAGEMFEPDPNLRNKYEISEEEFRDLVKKAFLEIQPYLEP